MFVLRLGQNRCDFRVRKSVMSKMDESCTMLLTAERM